MPAKADASPHATDAADLLFEIGCEEIPARMLTRALVDLPALVEARLTAARLTHGGVRALGTPRRLAVIVKQLADRQPDLREEVVGPPAGAAFAADGSLTKAGQGFAAKNAVEPGALVKREVAGKKGLYVIAIRSVVGQPTRSLLPALLTELARALPWPKSQRWGWGDTTFVRPVHWLVALFGGEVVPLSWAGVASGRHSRGHRFLANAPVEIAAADGYSDALRAAHVVVDPEVRRELVRAELARLETETGLRVRPDEGLLAEVIHLGEWPVGVSGTFDPSFLEVPEEIIVTAMRTHQRYFAMEDATGRLAPRFATLMATIVKDPAVVQRGNESVLASRLSDAKFFVHQDRAQIVAHGHSTSSRSVTTGNVGDPDRVDSQDKAPTTGSSHSTLSGSTGAATGTVGDPGPFGAWLAKLEHVVFQAKLGVKANTIGHKMRRLTELTQQLAGQTSCSIADAIRAARYCKADLASSAVGEFPELQGVMGKHYAKDANLPDAVAVAIEEHYWPKGHDAALPTTCEGALVAIADRIDTLVGCFAAGLAPSGSADPFGLRRAAIGVLAILLDRGPGGARYAANAGWPLRTDELIDSASGAYGDTLATQAAREPLREFFRTRLRGLLIDDGLAAQDVDVVLGVNADDPCDARLRARAVAVVPQAAREVFKRIANILDDARAKQHLMSGAVKPALFVSSDGAEARLWRAFTERTARLQSALDAHQYRDSFAVLAELGPDVAAFFDRGGVMVMDPDPVLRENRLSLLQQIYEPFARIADFRLLGGAA
jgi:glycyl-tRNA synthetase beta chain